MKKNLKMSVSLAIGVIVVFGILAMISGSGNVNLSGTSGSHSPTATQLNQLITVSPETTPKEQPTQVINKPIPVSSNPVVTTTATFSVTPTLNNPTKTINLPSTTLRETVTPPTSTPLLINKVTPAASQAILPDTLKLSPEERSALVKLDADINGLNASLNRLGLLMTDPHPEQSSWFDSLGKETAYWQDLENYYKLTPMPLRIGSQVMPVWLSALARMGRASKYLAQAYHNADGIAISQADQEVAFAELEISRASKISLSLKQK